MKHVLLLRVLFSACAALSVVYTVPRLRAGLGKTTFDDAYMFLRYAKHWLGGVQVPDPPGRSALSGQQTNPGVQELSTPVWQRQSASAQGRIGAASTEILEPSPATIAPAAA